MDARPHSELLAQARENLAYIARHKDERGEDHFCEDFGCSSVEPLCEGIVSLFEQLEALQAERDRLRIMLDAVLPEKTTFHVIEGTDTALREAAAIDAEDVGWRSAPDPTPPLIPGPMPSHLIPIQDEEWKGVNPLTGESFPATGTQTVGPWKYDEERDVMEADATVTFPAKRPCPACDGATIPGGAVAHTCDPGSRKNT